MIAAALIPLAMFANTTDPTPVGPELVEMVIADPTYSDGLCAAYGVVIDAIDAMGLDYSGSSTFVEAADAFIVITLEGDDYRLDNEARGTLTDWLHADCS